MSARTRIEWTYASWNPLTGCTKISPGCNHCYAERMAVRLKATGVPKYATGFKLTLHEDLLDLPLTWKRPHAIFVNSMADLFHKDVPAEFILRVFEVMRRADWHSYQILTKRSDRLLELSPRLQFLPHLSVGVTVENQAYAFRIDHLRRTGAATRFISMEPLLGPVRDLDLRGINWVYAGGESGPNARPMDPAWVEEIQAQCERQGVSFHLKQWGGKSRNKTEDEPVRALTLFPELDG
ncbi:MAG: phage Gp37/Gp68 family protein [Armatimonadota bacterium]|nr:phage Gp37/Gp68 family protein [Armatimonadota bacterium]